MNDLLNEGRKLLTPKQRFLSLLEVCVAISIVIAHNVYHAIPNEVPILVVLAIASFRIREGVWSAGLYGRPLWWPRTLIAALVCVVLLQVKDVILQPIGQHFWPGPVRVSSVISQAHDPLHTLRLVLFLWAFAAFGEEIGYRGYLLRRAIDVFGPSRWGVAVALLIAATTFGFGHFYKGATGILESTGSGLILGGAYLFSGRLWVSTLTHGVNDTLAVVFSFFGW